MSRCWWSGGQLEQFDRVSGWIVEHRLTAAGAGDDLAAELDAGRGQLVDLGSDVGDDEMDPVPTSGGRLTSVGKGTPGRTGRTAEEES